eukprot:364417-Chlamydomonas_euryale.AAC.1
MARCQYGSLPGFWVDAPTFQEPEFMLSVGWDNKPFGEPHPELPHLVNWSTAPFGSFRQVWNVDVGMSAGWVAVQLCMWVA